MYLLIRTAYSILSILPLSVLLAIGRLTGSLCYYLLPSRRKTAFVNCRLIGVPQEKIKKVVKSSFRHTFCSYLESFHVKHIDKKFLDEKVSVEYLGEKPEGHGYFMVSAHFGGWEISPYVLTGKLGLKGAAVARRVKDPKVDEFIVKQRVNSNVDYIHHRGAGEKINEYLDKGLTVGVLLDHSSMPKDSLAVPFFGINTTFMKGVPLLSVRRDYPILPIFILREEKGYKLIVYPVMYPDKSLKPKERVMDIARRINEIYEDVIRKYPEQWYLIHRRFKRSADENGKWSSTNIYD